MKNSISTECVASVICLQLVCRVDKSSIHLPQPSFHSWNLGTITVCSTQTLSFAEPLTFSVPLQVQESLNPNNLEYWMEDIYTPGYDSLLKRKEAEFRRAKACKIGALIAAAACTVILVIVVPICTMKSWGFYLFFSVRWCLYHCILYWRCTDAGTNMGLHLWRSVIMSDFSHRP